MLTDSQSKYFCELKAENELELAIESEAFIVEHGTALWLCLKMSLFLSQNANKAVKEIVGNTV